MELYLLNVFAGENIMNLYPEEVWKMMEDMNDQLRHQVTLENSRVRSLHHVNVTYKIMELKDMVQKLIRHTSYQNKRL